MAEPLTRTPDLPSFDTYPSELAPGRSLPSAGPGARLNDAAENVGTWVGTTVNRARALPEQLDRMRERFTVIAGRKREDAAGRAAEWKYRAQRRAGEVRESAEQQLLRARLRAQQVTNEYPLQVIAACAVLGFAAGVSLRLWRSRE